MSKGFDPTKLQEVSTFKDGRHFTIAYHVEEAYPKYTFIIIDREIDTQQPAAVFVVPQGSENEYHYGTDEGNNDLVEAIGAKRTILVYIDAHYEVPNLDSIITELGNISKQLIPTELRHGDAPILTAAEGVGNRKLLFEKKSDYNGTVIVEETENDDGTLSRRMKFDGFRTIVQSEAVVVDGKLDVEKSVAASPYQEAVRRGMCFFWRSHTDLPYRIAVIGAGGCTLSLGIKKLIPEARIVNVDIDPVVVEAAKEFFFSSHEETTAVLTVNGIEYISNLAERSIKSPLQNSVHAVVIDVDNKATSDSELIGPPPPFVQQNCLHDMIKCLFVANMNSLTPPMVIINLVAREQSLRQKTLSDIARNFQQVYVWQGSEDVNAVVFCFPHTVQPYNIDEHAKENEAYKGFLECLQRIK